MVTKSRDTALPCTREPSSSSWPAGPPRHRVATEARAFPAQPRRGHRRAAPDSQGRITLSADHRRYAGLTRTVW